LKLIISEAAGFPGGLVRFGRMKAAPFALAIAGKFLKSRVRLGANHTAKPGLQHGTGYRLLESRS
jgi:hypothetical protein